MIMFVVFCVCFPLPQRAKYTLQTSYIKCVQPASKILQPKTIIATNITLSCRGELSETNPMCTADCGSTVRGFPSTWTCLNHRTVPLREWGRKGVRYHYYTRSSYLLTWRVNYVLWLKSPEIACQPCWTATPITCTRTSAYA